MQDFITNIGVPTVQDWNRRAREQLRWGFKDHPVPPTNPVMTDVPLPLHGTSHYVFLGQPASPVLQSSISHPSQPSGSQQSQASTDYGFDDYNADFLTHLGYQERINQLTAELEEVQESRNELLQQLKIYERMLDIDTVPSLLSQAVSESPKTPSRSQKAVSQRTPTPGPDSPFVTIHSGKSRSPFPVTPSRTPAPNRELTTPSTTRVKHTARFTSPVPSHDAISSSRSQVISPTSTSSVTIGDIPSVSIIDHILARHDASHLKLKVLLIAGIMSDARDAETFAKELEKLGLPPTAISGILKAVELGRVE